MNNSQRIDNLADHNSELSMTIFEPDEDDDEIVTIGATKPKKERDTSPSDHSFSKLDRSKS